MEVKIDTIEVKRKLEAGGFTSWQLDEFCRLLSGRLGETITPLIFLLEYSLLTQAVENGRNGTVNDGWDNQVSSTIAGLAIGGVLALAQSMIIRKVFPEDFAAIIFTEKQSVLQEAVGRSR
jgi:hypothetical protein